MFSSAGEHLRNTISNVLQTSDNWLSAARWTQNQMEVTCLQVDFMPVYAEHLRNIIKHGVDRKDKFDRPLEGFKVAVDPGNGAGGYFATDVLQPLGCDVSGRPGCVLHM